LHQYPLTDSSAGSKRSEQASAEAEGDRRPHSNKMWHHTNAWCMCYRPNPRWNPKWNLRSKRNRPLQSLPDQILQNQHQKLCMVVVGSQQQQPKGSLARSYYENDEYWHQLLAPTCLLLLFFSLAPCEACKPANIEAARMTQANQCLSMSVENVHEQSILCVSECSSSALYSCIARW